MSNWNQLNFQDSMSPMMYQMMFFHEFIMMFIMMISSLTMYLIILMILNKFYTNNIIDHQIIESIWTIIPMITLMIMAIPSIKILYLTDELKNPDFTIKAIGNQWYWTYEYPQMENMMFDDFMINHMIHQDYPYIFRLLDTYHRVVLPTNLKIRFLSTSKDVIHSFTIPSLGFKIDSIPGRINQTSTIIMYSGLYYGQCSEICGANHSFMPIVIEAVSMNYFMHWVSMTYSIKEKLIPITTI